MIGIPNSTVFFAKQEEGLTVVLTTGSCSGDAANCHKIGSTGSLQDVDENTNVGREYTQSCFILIFFLT